MKSKKVTEVTEEITAPEGHWIVVVSTNIWGAGKTLSEAKAKCRSQGSMRDGWVAKQTPEGVGVDEMDGGTYRHPGGCPDCKEVARSKNMRGVA